RRLAAGWGYRISFPQATALQPLEAEFIVFLHALDEALELGELELQAFDLARIDPLLFFKLGETHLQSRKVVPLPLARSGHGEGQKSRRHGDRGTLPPPHAR